jgi:hypothetical protein
LAGATNANRHARHSTGPGREHPAQDESKIMLTA